MTATAEHVLEEIRTLSVDEKREIWRQISHILDQTNLAVKGEQDALEAVHSLYGRFAGGGMLTRLLQERARDRAREETKRHRMSSHPNG